MPSDIGSVELKLAQLQNVSSLFGTDTASKNILDDVEPIQRFGGLIVRCRV
jgi:hypothetical protein